MEIMSRDKNVYILGAGFSKELSLPLQDEFLLVAKEVYFRNQEAYSYFKNVFKYQDKLSKMRKFLNYSLLNLEQLFNLLEMDVFYSSNQNTPAIKKDFINLICTVLMELTPKPLDNDDSGHLRSNSTYDIYLNFLKLFFKDSLNYHDDSIITFNYDLVFN